METRIQKWGNSFAIRIPKTIAKEIGIENNSPVEILLKNGKVVISPKVKPKMNLQQLLSKVNKKNLHNEVDTGSAMGGEVW
ncbi:MAG TPA: AbrB/MazE/SpoVT family DNA-binding domain-containing protein [bacterium]|nr:AbrB/MazE/SpoVT family DNA-binding domain-containing protein [bacterium]